MENEIKVLCAYKEMVDINSLQANPLNANKHPKEQIEVFKKIILYNGVRRPITVSTRSGYITKGHGEWETLKALGMEKVPVDFQDYDSEMQEIADMNADNTLSRMSYLDTAKMQELVIKLDEANFDLELAGIPQNKVEILATQPPEWFSENPDPFFGSVPQLQNPEPKKGLVDDDEVPEVLIETDIKLGDLFQLGDHRLLCGDSTDAAQVERLMNGEKADMVFTDPPYNLAEKTKCMSASWEVSHKQLKKADWDKNFQIESVFNSITNSIANDCSVYVCTSSFLAGSIWEWMEVNFNFYGWTVWTKPNPCPSLTKRDWTYSAELICYARKGKHTFNFPKEGHALNWWKIQQQTANRVHPTQKPVELSQHAIIHSSNPNHNILDLFGGSGSTLIACEKTNRKCFMMELDPQYCQVIIDRWEKFTGQKALKIS